MRGIVEQPKGFIYQSEFITVAEETGLLEFLQKLSYTQVVMHRVVAKRVTKHYGVDYDYGSRQVVEGESMPEIFKPLARRAEEWAGLKWGELAELLVTKYPYGAAIGWHRDAPAFGDKIVGISLLSPCVMQFEHKTGKDRYVYERILNPRSAYIIGGEARYVWLHHIPPAKSERYSLTFRTLKPKIASS